MQNETVARYSNTFSTTRCIEMQISLVRARPKATTHVPSLLRQTTLPPHSQPLRCTHAARSATAQQSVPRAAGDLHRESSSASHQSRAKNSSITRSTASQPHRSRWAALLVPFWQPNGTSRATTFTMGSGAPPDSSACKGGTPSVAISMPSLQNGKPSSIAVTI